MKIKIDFITNSSSASFTILRSDLTPLQEILIIDHIEAATMFLKKDPTIDFGWLNAGDEWSITVTEDKIEGDCSMDNFCMTEFLNKIGVPDEKIDYDHS